jgi:uncharacterized membrane protein HdeD (DUF308 family)
MRLLQGWGALTLGVLFLFNLFNVVEVFSLAIGVSAMVLATLTFLNRLQERRFSINALLLGVFGVALVLNREEALQSVMQLLALLIVGIGTSNLIQARRRRVVSENTRFLMGAGTVVLGVLLFVFPGLPLTLLRLGFSIALIGYGLLRLNTQVVPFATNTWNETIRRTMNAGASSPSDVIDVDAEERPPKK